MDPYDNRAPEDDVQYEEFYNAASEGNIQRLEAALLPSMSVDALEANLLQGRAALHIAAQVGSVPAIQWLLAHGATVDLRNSEGETPLHEAAGWVQPEAIKALLAAGADINASSADYSHTPLLHVLSGKHTVTPREIETIELLLDRGSDVNYGLDDIWIGTLVCSVLNLRPMPVTNNIIARSSHTAQFLRVGRNSHRQRRTHRPRSTLYARLCDDQISA